MNGGNIMDYVKLLSQQIEQIYDDIDEEKRRKDGRAQIAIVKDSTQVIIGQKVYPAECATDVFMTAGREVYVQLTAGNSAIVIGDAL